MPAHFIVLGEMKISAVSMMLYMNLEIQKLPPLDSYRLSTSEERHNLKPRSIQYSTRIIQNLKGIHKHLLIEAIILWYEVLDISTICDSK